ncbi:flagellar motor switch protein FliM [Caldicoprobacter algeriensis]|uniref:flagellar motor switch protein FliM n=1 Tax=Caldicoprobacter algeriensis TaxID=699281 RepID=UPI0020792BDF|nr:flagellar motor switch protein FliM [Caldicoprobacter algeriensis]
MAEVLSQREIDELLAAFMAGAVNINEIKEETPGKKISVYDFRRPKKFAKDQLRTLQIIHENFARLMGSYFSGILRTYCQIDLVSVEPQTYGEFINSLPDPVVLGIIEFRPLKGSIILEFSPNVVYAIIDRMLGGLGLAPEKVRDFTEIEIVLIERIIKQLLPIMNSSWANIVNAEFTLEHIETNAQFAQLVSPNESIAIVTLDAHIGDVEGMMNICIPYLVIEPIIQQLSSKHWFSTKLAEENERKFYELLASQIETTPVELKAVLGETSITIRDLIELQKGDVIKLDKKVDEDIDVYVGGVKKFWGVVGLKKNNLAIQITSICKEGGKV